MALVLCVNILICPDLTSKAVGAASRVIPAAGPEQMALRLQEEDAAARLILMTSKEAPPTYGADNCYYYAYGGFYIMTYAGEEQAEYAREKLAGIYGEEKVFLDEKISLNQDPTDSGRVQNRFCISSRTGRIYREEAFGEEGSEASEEQETGAAEPATEESSGEESSGPATEQSSEEGSSEPATEQGSEDGAASDGPGLWEAQGFGEPLTLP